MRKGSTTNLNEGASEEAQSSTVEPEPMPSNNESHENDGGEDESGEEDEEYKEDPWHYSNTSLSSTQLDPESTPSESAPTSDATFQPDPERTIDNGKESKRESNYKTQNQALQRLFRPRPLTNTTTQDDREEQESSSVEWGQIQQKTLQEQNEEWQVWNETNIHETTPAYRHDRCHFCSKPVTTTNLVQNRTILCNECAPHVIKDDLPTRTEGKQGHEKRERDSEEEWGGIPIPQSDDSQSTEDYPSDESDHEKTQVMMGCVHVTLRQKGDELAFLLAPRLDGKVINKDGLILDPNEPITKPPTKFQPSHPYESPNDVTHEGPPQWTNHLLAYQRRQLRKGYRKKTRLKAKILRKIRKPANTVVHKTQKTENSKPMRTHLTCQPLTLQSGDTLHETTPSLTQCMIKVAFDSPKGTKRKTSNKRTQQEDTPNTRHVKNNRPRHKWPSSWNKPLSPILIPGTPDSIQAPDASSQTELTAMKELDNSDSEDSIDLYYKAYDKYKPDIDESNAESRARMESIFKEIQRLKTEKKRKQTRIKDKHQDGYTTPEPYKLLQNSSLELDLHTPPAHGPDIIHVIMDTGAALSMFTGSEPTAWTNLRPCLYSITGCFRGEKHTDLQMGQFHGIVTLDSGEVVRVIIPESVYIPPEISHSCLLANTPFLMAGHQYVNDLYAPVLKFKGGGKITLSVQQGHHILRLIPTHALQPTQHRTIYLHKDETYDPPTFVNETLFQNLNRPCLHTPTAFKWHLRYGCKSLQILKHTQKHIDGMHIQKGSWDTLASQLPCSACVAGKMRKSRKNPTREYTEMTNLALSWDATTKDHENRPNERVSLDWGIINKQYIKDKKNVFALYLDLNTGLVFGYPADSTGQAGLSLSAYIQRYGIPKTIVHDNAKEFIHGEFAQLCEDKSIQQIRSPPFTPNENPTEHYMEIITSTMRCLLFISGLDPAEFWEHALQHAVNLQIRTALPGRCTPYELTHGRRPNVLNLRIFGCEALAYIEKDKRKKLQPKVHKTIYLGFSDHHEDHTFKLYDMKTKQVIYRKNVYFNERHFPARKTKHLTPSQHKPDTGEDLIGQDFEDDGITWVVTKAGLENDSIPILYYQNKETKEEERSSVKEVRTWYNRTVLQNAVNTIATSRKGFINNLAEETYKTIMSYDVKLPNANVPKPTSFNKASNNPFPQWFQAEDKERNGMLEFQTWEYLNQKEVTPAMRQRALRCHHLYDIKRDLSAKNRVVVNGSRQHADTYTDTTSPVASQLQTRLFLCVSAFRKYDLTQLDLTNAYLHAPIQDVVYIIIPEGFPNAGAVARLRKAAYGTKQGARRFYDHTANIFKQIGMIQCPNEPCLFRYLLNDDEAFIIQYVDDSLIAGKPKAVRKLKEELDKYFQCKFNTPKDFLGLDITNPKKGEITLSMESFTKKMTTALQFTPTHDGPVLTPGRTDKKVIKGLDPEPNEHYRSKVGILNWLTMGVRFDLVYVTKELSRVLAEPTKIANELVDRAIEYTIKTKEAHLVFSHAKMAGFQPPPTRKKPTDNAKDKYDVSEYNIQDGIKHTDDTEKTQEYIYKGEQLTLTCQTDIDLAGQVETRQSTSSLVIYLNGAIVHYRAATERVIIQSTAAGEYIALSRGNTTTKFIRDILQFYGNTQAIYYLYTDNQAAEHIATQPNMNEHSRSIDIRHHAIRQDYVDGLMRIGGVDTQDNTSDLLTKYLQPPLHIKHTSQLHFNTANSVTNTHTSLIINMTHAMKNDHHTRMDKTRKLTRRTSCPSQTTIPRSQPTHHHNLHRQHQNWNIDPHPSSKSPKSQIPTPCGSTRDSRQPQHDQPYPSRNPSRRHRRTQPHHTPPYTSPATMAHIPPKTCENHPKTRHDRRGDRRTLHLRPHHLHPAHTSICPTHTPMCHTHQHPAPPYPTPVKHTHCPLLGHSQPSRTRNFECFCQRRAATSNKNLRRKRIFNKIKLHTKMHTKKRHKSCHNEKSKFATYRYWKPKICQNGHKFWVQAYTTIKYNPHHPEFRTQHPSDRIPSFSGLRCQHQHFCRKPPDRIRNPHPSLLTEPHYKMCSQKQFLDTPEQYNQSNRTNMGPNTRLEAILDIESDILDSLKRLGKFTTEMSSKHLQSMPYDVFTRKQAALPQFKRLCKRTIRATRDGQQLAPRRTKHDIYYRLFEEFMTLLDMQNDLLLEIEESMDSVKHLHEFRQQHLTQHTFEFKPVKNRPPTPAPTLTLRELMDRVPSPSPSYYKSMTPPARSQSGYSSSSSSSSESASTTTTVTTTVKHKWTPDQSSTCSSSPHPDYVY
jgi:hypothetical protein